MLSGRSLNRGSCPESYRNNDDRKNIYVEMRNRIEFSDVSGRLLQAQKGTVNNTHESFELE